MSVLNFQGIKTPEMRFNIIRSAFNNRGAVVLDVTTIGQLKIDLPYLQKYEPHKAAIAQGWINSVKAPSKPVSKLAV